MTVIFGLIFTFIIALLATGLHVLPMWPFTLQDHTHPLEAMIIALVLGILLNHMFTFSTRFQPGINFSVKRLLPFAIILLGAQLNLLNVIRISLEGLLLNLVCVIFALLITLWLCKKTAVEKKLSLLLAVGTAICGGTAIILTSPIIKANAATTAMAVATIALFGLLAIFLFPLFGHALEMDSTMFGLWVGTSIQAVPQVVAAGFAYSLKAGQIGTIVKLVRVLLLAPMIVVLNFWQARQDRSVGASKDKTRWSTYFPPFILGFLAMTILSSLGLFQPFTLLSTTVQPLPWMQTGSSFLFTMVMAGIGLQTDLKSFRHTGAKALGIGFLSALILALVSLALLKLI